MGFYFFLTFFYISIDTAIQGCIIIIVERDKQERGFIYDTRIQEIK